MANQQAAELTEAGIGSLDDPVVFVAAQFAAIFLAQLFAVAPIGRDQLDAAFLQTFPQRVRIIDSVGHPRLRLLLGTAFGARAKDFGERGFRKASFSWVGTLQPNSQRKTLTVDQYRVPQRQVFVAGVEYHPFRALATPGFTDCSAPILTGAKLPSMKHSSHFSIPLPSRSQRRTPSAKPNTFVFPRFSRGRQVAGDGNSSDRNRQAAPVCRIHRMPSKHARLDVQGRPQLSRRLLGSGSKVPVNSRCSPVNSFCRSFMAEVQQQPASR